MPAPKLEKLLRSKVEQFGISFDEHVIAIASEGCSLMVKLGENLEQQNIHQQLCLSHCVHLAVDKVVYKQVLKTKPKNPPIQVVDEQDRNLKDDTDDDGEGQNYFMDEESHSESDTAQDESDEMEEDETDVESDEEEIELEPEDLPQLTGEIGQVIKKLKSAIKAINFSPIKTDILNKEIQKWQKRSRRNLFSLLKLKNKSLF